MWQQSMKEAIGDSRPGTLRVCDCHWPVKLAICGLSAPWQMESDSAWDITDDVRGDHFIKVGSALQCPWPWPHTCREAAEGREASLQLIVGGREGMAAGA